MAITVAILAYDGFGFLDVVGPADVFTVANQQAGRELYRLRVLGPGRSVGPGTEVMAESGLRLGVDGSLHDPSLGGASFGDRGSGDTRAAHTFLVSGGDGASAVASDPDAVAAVAGLAGSSTRTVSVCTGAFVLAAAGLLDGRPATTHWAHADRLQAEYPKVRVTADELFVRSGPIITAAGIAAGIDLALALVADDHGDQLARIVSRRMVLYRHRSGGQSQFTERPVPRSNNPDELDRLLAEIVADPTGDLGNAAMSRRLSVSERHLVRLFRQRTGTTPAQWVNQVRVDRARDRLETTTDPVERIADLAGFGSVHTMRQVFQRAMGLSPQQYRQRHRRSARRS